MNQALVKVNQQDLENMNPRSSSTASGSFMTPGNLGEALKVAELIAKSDLAPKEFRGKPENVLIAVQMGAEVGLAPMQAIQNIAVINGKPCVYGDAMLAIVQNSGKLASMDESFEYDPKGEAHTAYVLIERADYPGKKSASFSLEDAKRAGLLGKENWQKYPKRMLQMRARAFALRDLFADVLKGLSVREEIEDYSNRFDHNERKSPSIISMPQRRSTSENKAVEITPVIEQEDDESLSEVYISEGQIKRLFAIAHECEVTHEEIKSFLKENYHIEQTRKILKSDYESIVNWIQNHREPGMEG